MLQNISYFTKYQLFCKISAILQNTSYSAKYQLFLKISAILQNISYFVQGPKFYCCRPFQDIMERAIIDIFADRNVIEPGSYVHEFPYPCYMNDQ